ncbi:MAG: histidine phosphatase family protein [Candidatus Thermoplasmatota archaeon]|jgi:probable phosphoglycerate mutase|nr:histidine phosphatase family protein [Candidatus Thermoplasmatota archaeon]
MKPNLVIAVARHGQTNSNVRGLWIGTSGDDPLNETGIEQAKALAHSLSEFSFDFVISSDKMRAVQTAEIVSKTISVPIYGQKPILRDRNYGTLEGMTTEQIREKYGVEMRSLSEDIDDLGATENVSSVLRRVREFVETSKTLFGGKKILVITHGAFIRSFYEMYVRDSDGLRFTNCANFVVGFDGDSHELLRDLRSV